MKDNQSFNCANHYHEEFIMYWTAEEYSALAADIIRNGDADKRLTQDIIVRACARVNPDLFLVGETISPTRIHNLKKVIDLQKAGLEKTEKAAQAAQSAMLKSALGQRQDLADLMFKSLLKEQTEDILVRVGHMFQAMSQEIYQLRTEVVSLKAALGEGEVTLPEDTAAQADPYVFSKPEEPKPTGKKRIHVFHLESRSFRELEDSLRSRGLLKFVDLTYTPTTGGVPNCNPDKYDVVYFSNLFVRGGLVGRLKKSFTNVVGVEGGNSKIQEVITRDLTSWKDTQVKDMIG